MIMKPRGVDTSGLDRILQDAAIADQLKAGREQADAAKQEKRETVEDLKNSISDIVGDLDNLQANLMLEQVEMAKNDSNEMSVIESFIRATPSNVEAAIAQIGTINDAAVLANLESALHDYSVGDHITEEQTKIMGAVSDRKRELLS